MPTDLYLPEEMPAPAPVKKRDAVRTKAAILAAAKEAFATRGYREAGVREIAAAAGVNWALIRRYFGSKEQLYEAALNSALDIKNLLACDRADFGRHAIRHSLGTAKDYPNAVLMLILGTTDLTARNLALSHYKRQVIGAMAKWIGPPNAEVRAGEVIALLTGLYAYWKILPLNGAATRIGPEMRAWLEKSLQAIIDQEEETPLERDTSPVVDISGPAAHNLE
jgi:AcrR family transcriptional regulator